MLTYDFSRTRGGRRGSLLPLLMTCVAAVFVCGCPETVTPPGGGNGDTISGDMTMSEFNIAEGETTTVENDAVVTVDGDVTIDGALEAMDSRLTLRVNGKLTINGTLMSMHAGTNGVEGDKPFKDHEVGIHIIVGDEEVTISSTAVLQTTGSVVITDDETVLDGTPDEFFDQVEDVMDDTLPSFAPLPSDSPVFGDANTNGNDANTNGNDANTNGNDVNTNGQPKVTGPAGMPINISGEWPDPNDPAPAGDKPVWIFRFNGNRPLNLMDWTVNGPAAPDGADTDPDEGTNSKRGKNGMRLNIWNNGGPININNVVLNLADGGAGGNDMDTCANATGKKGGKSGNFRMTAAGGINMTGPLTINPGASGDGGSATVTKGMAGAAGCDGDTGASSTATGADGTDNKKRIFARGNVTGLANVTIGALFAGNGGDATAEACDGGPGIACCSGGPGGEATSTAGNGGEASLNISGLPITAGGVIGGEGGVAEATGGNGGDGGDCKFGDAGDGGVGGVATADGGQGGDASGGTSVGGDAGDATGTGGDGGVGGDSGLGNPGAGGAFGAGTATVKAAGTGDTAGSDGEADPVDGATGANGGDIAVVVFCIPPASFVVQPDPGEIVPGPKGGPVFNEDETEEVGTAEIEFVDFADRDINYQLGINPDHIGIGDGVLRIDLVQLQLVSTMPVPVGGLRIVPLQGFGIDEANPLVVRALDAKGGLIGERMFGEIPNNFNNLDTAQPLEAFFETTDADPSVEAVPAVFEIEAPAATFVTIFRIYLIDP
ncbi:MAG: hypothetical protein GXP29_01070 [Planctomycetes bacterium]|nr:hypothetical protein [Planctomycetota bacterium]